MNQELPIVPPVEITIEEPLPTLPGEGGLQMEIPGYSHIDWEHDLLRMTIYMVIALIAMAFWVKGKKRDGSLRRIDYLYMTLWGSFSALGVILTLLLQP